ncbi:MAG: F0F1 ATP synthase subunit epsilon [Neisseriaceae bacterium]|nr:F0F1 ATP synthase subunit epsilon [Neisseriaceae bacterium]
MSDIMQVEVVSNEEQIYSGEASFVVVPTRSGELGIYPKHTPIMSLLKPGLLRLVVPGQSEEIRIGVSGGLLEVQPDNIKILSDIAIRSEEMDQKRAEESKRMAEEKLKTASSDKEREKAETALELAIAELKALDYIKTHK